MSCEPCDERVQALKGTVTAAFERVYGGQPELIVVSPGRVNVIGEHTDYNDGFVLPAAIDRHVVIGLRPRADGRVRVHAADFDDTATFALDTLIRTEQQSWANYHQGRGLGAAERKVMRCKALMRRWPAMCPWPRASPPRRRWRWALRSPSRPLSGFELDGVKRALLCQKAENEFVGMNCGIMDQYIVSLGKAGHVLLIDCRSLGYELAPLPTGVSLVICDTRKKRGLVDSEYNTRRAECERGAATLGVKALRDVSPTQFEARKAELDPVTYRRCRHVVTEDARTLEAVAAMRAGDLQRLGELMNASHVSPARRLSGELLRAGYDGRSGLEAAWRLWRSHDGRRLWRLRRGPGGR